MSAVTLTLGKEPFIAFAFFTIASIIFVNADVDEKFDQFLKPGSHFMSRRMLHLH